MDLIILVIQKDKFLELSRSKKGILKNTFKLDWCRQWGWLKFTRQKATSQSP